MAPESTSPGATVDVADQAVPSPVNAHEGLQKKNGVRFPTATEVYNPNGLLMQRYRETFSEEIDQSLEQMTPEKVHTLVSAFLAHERIQGCIGEQRWIIPQVMDIGQKLLDPDYREDPVVIGPDGLRGRKMAEGGFGVVYEAVHKGNDAALKVFHPGKHIGNVPKARSRFYDEIKDLKTIDGQGAPRVYADGELPDGRPYCLMQWIHGWTLADLIDSAEERGLPPQFASEICVLAAATLIPIHQKNIFHRDIKPENIILDHEGKVWIIDWGLRGSEEHDDTRKTESGEILGSRNYWAPEQITNPLGANRLVDSYALGCTLYETLAGKPPFETNSLQEAVHAHLHREFDPSNVPPAFRETLFQLLAKDPERRAHLMNAIAMLLPYCSEGFRAQYTSAKNLVYTRNGAFKKHDAKRLQPPVTLQPADEISSVPGGMRDGAMPKMDGAKEIVHQGSISVVSVADLLAFMREKYKIQKSLSTTVVLSSSTKEKPWRPVSRTVGIAAGVLTVAAGTAGGVAWLLSGKSDDRPSSPDNHANIVHPSTTKKENGNGEKKIEAQPKRPRSIALHPAENGNPSRIVFFANDPEKSFEIHEGILFKDGDEIRGSTTQLILDANREKEIQEKHGERLASLLKKCNIHRYSRTVEGRPISFIIITGVGHFLFDDSSCVHFSLRMGLADPSILALCDRKKELSEAPADKDFRAFFQDLDLSTVAPYTELKQHGDRDIGTWLKIYRDTANLHIKTVKNTAAMQRP